MLIETFLKFNEVNTSKLNIKNILEPQKIRKNCIKRHREL